MFVWFLFFTFMRQKNKTKKNWLVKSYCGRWSKKLTSGPECTVSKAFDVKQQQIIFVLFPYFETATCVENEQKVIVYRCECKYSYCYTYLYYSWCERSPLPENTSSGITDKTRCMFAHTVGKISIEHITIFPSKCISKCAVDMTFSPDVSNNPSNPYIQRKQNKYVQKLSHV